jgi:hypothetical protein
VLKTWKHRKTAARVFQTFGAAHLDQALLSRWLLLLQPPKQPQRERVHARHELEHFNL